MKIGIIGGGAAGLVAAIYAKTEENEVIIFEKKDSCAKKILMTGNGRCNYWNENQEKRHYHSENPEIVKEIMTEENAQEVLSFFDMLGVVSKIKNGYYYPYSNQASTIKTLLLKEIERKKIETKENFEVDEIEKKGNHFLIKSKEEEWEVDRVILATGSSASLREKDNNGYRVAQSFGHNILPLVPSLVPLVSARKDLKKWAGVRSNAIVSLWVEDQCYGTEEGELQWTEDGLSGICIFNLSGMASKALSLGQKVSIKIQWMPWLRSVEEGRDWFDDKKRNTHPLENVLVGFLNPKLIEILLKTAMVSKNQSWKALTEEEKNRVLNVLFSLEIPISKTKSLERAQVCKGGIPLSEIVPSTMESKKEKGLYMVGELLDVDGDCGGYNLGFAWTTGMLAGKGVRK